MANKNVLLIEPGYKNEIPAPGPDENRPIPWTRRRERVSASSKGEVKSVLDQAWDRIYVTTLFSFEFARIAQSTYFAKQAAGGQTDKIFVGGIAASLMQSPGFRGEPRAERLEHLTSICKTNRENGPRRA